MFSMQNRSLRFRAYKCYKKLNNECVNCIKKGIS